ncbi:MAG: Uma2 family endonuclease [Gemmatimonadales bacterium]
MSAARPLMTADELLTHPSYRNAELVSGHLWVAEPPGGIHGRLASRIDRLLGTYVDRHHLGTVLVEAGYLLRRHPDTVRGPDISFVARQRMAPDQFPAAFIEGAPDLAVEIASPSDSWPALLRKVADYLEAGARLVWLVDPVSESVMACRAATAPRVLIGQDRLDGGDVLPGFAWEVRELFR